MRTLTVLAFLTLSLGCAHGGGKKYDEASVSKVRKTAVVGYTLLQEAAVKDIPLPAMPGGLGSHIPGINTFPKVTEHAAEVLAVYEKAMGDRKKWKVIPFAQVAGNSVYSAIFAGKMVNWKNKQAPRKDTQFLFAEGILDYDTAERLNQNERDQLMTSLGVDSLAVIKVDVVLKKPGGLSINGIGQSSLHPFATAHFTLYSKGSDKPIWEAWHETKGGEQAVSTGGSRVDQERMNVLSKSSAKTAFMELLANTAKE
jgi:hypothetical protein